MSTQINALTKPACIMLAFFTLFFAIAFKAEAQTPRPVTICSGANIIIKGDSPNGISTSYLWQYYQAGSWLSTPGANGELNYLASSLINTGTLNIIFNLRRRIVVNGIIQYDSYYLVTVQPILPILNNSIVTPSVTSICGAGMPTTIIGSTASSGTSTMSYQWQSSTDNINFSNIDGAFDKDYSPDQITKTIYFRRIAISAGCGLASTSNTINLTVYSSLSANVITGPAVLTFCTNGNAGLIIGNIPSGGNGTYVYQWQKSADNVTYADIVGANGKDYDPPASSVKTFYRRNVSSAPCYTPLSSGVIAINILPTLSAPVVTVANTTQKSITFQWTAVTGATGYKVSVDNGLTYVYPSSGSTGLTHTVSGLTGSQVFTIMVKATGVLPCQESDSSIPVTGETLEEFGDLYVANAFTPNGDGNNDIVYVHSQTIKTLEFNVFNQWGQQIFHANNLANGWDGTYRGSNQPAGVYIYTVKAVMNNGLEVSKKGTITLLR